MKKCGLIVEYNPLTNGHLYHLNKAKEMTQADLVIAVMSGNFTQRGEPAIVDKWERAKTAIVNGVDLVIELPFAFACESADYFAQGAIEILQALDVDVMVFGTETLTPKDLKKMVEITQQPTYQQQVAFYLKQGDSYPSALAKSYQNHAPFQPNDLLAIAYAKQIAQQKANIEILTIQRTNAYHDNMEGSSASSLRQRLKLGYPIHHLSPMTITGQLHDIEELFEPLYQRLLLSDPLELAKIHLVSEGIEARLIDKISTSISMGDFLNQVKTKRYTTSRLLRTIVHILINDTSGQRDQMHVGYLRLLGASQKGQKALRQLKKEASLPIVSNFSELKHPHLDLELKATTLYALAYPIEQRNKIIQKEYATVPYFEKSDHNHC